MAAALWCRRPPGSALHPREVSLFSCLQAESPPESALPPGRNLSASQSTTPPLFSVILVLLSSWGFAVTGGTTLPRAGQSLESTQQAGTRLSQESTRPVASLHLRGSHSGPLFPSPSPRDRPWRARGSALPRSPMESFKSAGPDPGPGRIHSFSQNPQRKVLPQFPRPLLSTDHTQSSPAALRGVACPLLLGTE